MMLTRIITFIILFLSFLHAGAADPQVLYVAETDEPTTQSVQLRIACDFYGVRIVQTTPKQTVMLLKSAADLFDNYSGIIVSSDILSTENGKNLLGLFRIAKRMMRVLVMGVRPKDDLSALNQYFEMSLVSKKMPKLIQRSVYVFSERKDIAFELSGLTIRYPRAPREYVFSSSESDNFECLIALSGVSMDQLYPTFIRKSKDKLQLLLATGLDLSNYNNESHWDYSSEYFMELAPILMFLRSCLRESCWQPANRFANLTIDDPFLVEPYGSLHYYGLLEEMQRHNFHTTIAFIPYNYSRNEVAVINMFRENRYRYSICFHGNNHDRREFDNLGKRPLVEQEKDIQQAIIRMNRFGKITGLKYDNVMVFPHGIAPKETISILKRYNFSATFNESNIPLGEIVYDTPGVKLRNVTLSYSDFQSYSRHGLSTSYSFDSNIDVEYWKSVVASDLFLGNPVVFYVHQDFFSNDIGAFNVIADMVNSIDAKVRWTSLGEIAQYGYLFRKVNEFNYDVRAFSTTMKFENKRNQRIIYNIIKNVPTETIVKGVVTNPGGEIVYKISNGFLRFTLELNPGDVKKVEIEEVYEKAALTIAADERDLRVVMLRLFSDFRDLSLSSSRFGKQFNRLYYTHRSTAYLLIVIAGIMYSLTITLVSYTISVRMEQRKDNL